MVRGRDSPVRWNSGLLEAAEEIVTLDPVAVSTSASTLLEPTVTLPKFKALALEVNFPAAAPVPDTAIVRLGVDAFESTTMVPFTLPAACGVKRTLKVTLCPWFK